MRGRGDAYSDGSKIPQCPSFNRFIKCRSATIVSSWYSKRKKEKLGSEFQYNVELKRASISNKIASKSKHPRRLQGATCAPMQTLPGLQITIFLLLDLPQPPIHINAEPTNVIPCKDTINLKPESQIQQAIKLQCHMPSISTPPTQTLKY